MKTSYIQYITILTIGLLILASTHTPLFAEATYNEIDRIAHQTATSSERVWLSENPKVKTFNNDDRISNVKTNTNLELHSEGILQPAYSYADNDSEQTSLIENGDFETGDFTGWNVHADNAVVQSAETMGNPSHLIDGTYSGYKNWGDGDIISQPVELEPGQEYTLSFEGFLAWNWIYLYARVFDTSTNEMIAETNIHKTDSLTATVNFVAPEGGSVEIWFTKEVTDADPGRVGIDNITLVEAETATSNELDLEQPKEIGLSQNYPNPFNPTTSISFNLPEATNVSLSVYNMIGQKVAVLVDGRRTAGEHTVAFDASSLSSGVYIYRLRSGSMTITKKMTLLK